MCHTVVIKKRQFQIRYRTHAPNCTRTERYLLTSIDTVVVWTSINIRTHRSRTGAGVTFVSRKQGQSSRIPDEKVPTVEVQHGKIRYAVRA